MRDPHFMERGMGIERGIPVDRGLPMERMHIDRGRPSAERGLSPHRGMPPLDRRGPPIDHPGRPINPGPPEMAPRMSRPPPPPERSQEPRGSRPMETPPDQDQEKVSKISLNRLLIAHFIEM